MRDRSGYKAFLCGLAILLAAGFLVLARAASGAAAPAKESRLFVLMVWDGLRPDLVTEQYTPNLFAMEHAGVEFAHHHAVYPTLTMANAASIATGAPPASSGIYGNKMYLLPALRFVGAGVADPSIAGWIEKPVALERLRRLAALNGPKAFAGRLLGLETIAQQVRREGGYIALIGKEGPAFLFDDNVTAGSGGNDYLFVSDDLIEPASAASRVGRPPVLWWDAGKARDGYFARAAVEEALPAAKRAIEAGRPALVVFWQHNPDITQHLFGLGTKPAIEALANCDANLRKVRGAIKALGIADRTDLMVVSDHGFATLKMRVELGAILVKEGLKKSAGSTDVVVARNDASDLIYLSSTGFANAAERRMRLQQIVDFAEAQKWCGPIFSRKSPSRPTRTVPQEDYLGLIDGTFNEAAVGLYNPARSPDLVISFLELPDADNRGLTGSRNPAFELGPYGQQRTPNHSAPLVHPVKGVAYADVSSFHTTGMGVHGTAGRRELHNFCAAIGPDFRPHMIDPSPTGNVDIAPTIANMLGLHTTASPGGFAPAGRVMSEALAKGGAAPGPLSTVTTTVRLKLKEAERVTTLRFSQIGPYRYLDGSSVRYVPLRLSPQAPRAYP
jgi:Type I phosphodiesterase / nucleotide pyrophosphatase